MLRFHRRFRFDNTAALTVAPAAASTTWDPATAGAGMVLSNNNLTATNSASHWYGVVTSKGNNAGLKYLELTASTSGSLNFNFASVDNTYDNNSAGGVGAEANYGSDGTSAFDYNGYFHNGGGVTPTFASGDIISVAINFTTGHIFAAQNGDFTAIKGGSDPSADTSPAWTFTNDGRLVYVQYFGFINNSVTLNPGPSFAYSLPTGYSAWS